MKAKQNKTKNQENLHVIKYVEGKKPRFWSVSYTSSDSIMKAMLVRELLKVSHYSRPTQAQCEKAVAKFIRDCELQGVEDCENDDQVLELFIKTDSIYLIRFDDIIEVKVDRTTSPYS